MSFDIRQAGRPNSLDSHQVIQGGERAEQKHLPRPSGPMCFMRSSSSAGAEFTSTYPALQPCCGGGSGVAVGKGVAVGGGSGVAVA